MKISMKTDYALRALMTLVEHYGRGPIPTRELARRNEIPVKFLEHIMLDLKGRKWVSSRAGKYGGYVLEQDPRKIMIGHVVRHFEGVLAPIGCVSTHHYERCTQEPVCRFRRLFLEIRNEVAQRMDQTSLADLHAGRPVSEPEVFDDKYIHGDGI